MLYLPRYMVILTINKADENEIKNHLRDIPGYKLIGEKSLIELSTYNDIALWWFTDFTYKSYLNRFSCVPDDITKPTHWERIINVQKKYYFFRLLYFLYRSIISTICKMNVRLYNINNVHKKTKILVTAQNGEWRARMDRPGQSYKKEDAFFGSTISMLQKDPDYEIITTYPVGNPLSGLKIIVDKRKNQEDIIHKPFDIYLSFSAWNKSQKAKNYFLGLRDEIKNNDRFNAWINYNGIYYSPIKDEILKYFTTTFGYTVQQIETAKKMMETERPDLILIQNEYSSFERSLVVAGKLNNIPVLGVQHGIITPSHDGYIHSKDEVSKNGSVNSPY